MSDDRGCVKTVDDLHDEVDEALPICGFDPDRYRVHLSDIEIDQAQQDELLRVLWEMMSTMVNIGWGVDNVQLVLPELFNEAHEVDARPSKTTPTKGGNE